MSKEIGITVKKAENFSEYTQVVTKAELADYSSMKGFMIIRLYGYSIWEQMKEHVHKDLSPRILNPILAAKTLRNPAAAPLLQRLNREPWKI